MLTVNQDGADVDVDLRAGRIFCPRCGEVLRPWGWARERLIREGTGSGRSLVAVLPRRARCSGCAVTQVLLGLGLAGRRADTAAVIAAAVEAKVAGGLGHRPIAVLLGRPPSTVRGWLRSFAASAEAVLRRFTVLAHRDGADAAGLWPAPAPSLAGQALASVTAYAGVLAGRFAVAVLPWQAAGLAAAGPFFFSTSRWQPGVQHELTLTGVAVSGKGGNGAG